MGSILTIARKDLTQNIRDRSFFILGVVAPLAIMTVFNVTIGDALSGTFNPVLRLVDESGLAGAEIVAGLEEAGFVNVELVDSAGEARAAVEDGDADAAIIFPAALAQAVVDPTMGVSIEVVTNPDSELSANIARSIADSTASTIRSARAINAALVANGAAPTDRFAEPTVEVVDSATGGRTLIDATYFAVAMTAYFVFFTAQAGIAAIHRERREGTLARMVVAPVPRFAAIAGKGLASALTGLVAFTVLWAISTVALGSDWGPPLGVAVIGIAAILAAVGIATLVTSITSSEETAGQINGVLTTALAFLGGAFLAVPTTGIVGFAARFSPFKWIMDGIGENAGVGTFADVLAKAAVLALFGLVPLGIAAVRSERILRGAS